jgi:hypothetical protein
MSASFPATISHLGRRNVGQQLGCVKRCLGGLHRIILEGGIDLLGIKVLLMLTNESLSLICLKCALKDSIHEFLLFGEQSNVFSQHWDRHFIKHLGDVLSSCLCKGGSLPGIPLLFILVD